LRGRLSRLPAHTVVLYITMFQDAAGKTFTPRQALEAFASGELRSPVRIEIRSPKNGDFALKPATN
jgi:hypothetical protein